MNEKYVTSFRIVMAGIYTYLGAAIATILWKELGRGYVNLGIFAHIDTLAYIGIVLMVIGVIYGIKSWYDLIKNKI